MPESKSRKKPARPAREPRQPKPDTGNPRWLVPTMLTLMLVGLAWIVLFYLSGSAQLPIPALGAWNLGVGFAFIIAGFALTTRWK
ncbi:cell division protein CrgA [Cellulosimicrobium sp. PMB13]|uniref:cell division protein CrgA n=1 Tax=Cellulosimicrobium sp. PMB13 TaxID=3120158 RepID=UPI003F4B37A5